MSVFGEIFDAGLLEDAMTAYLQKWFRTFSAEIAEQRDHGRDRYKEPKFWTTTPVLTLAAVEQVRYPAVLIVSSGLVSKPVKRGKKYEGVYAVGVTILSTANDELAAGRMARRYGAAIRQAIIFKPSLEAPFVEGTEWADERFGDYIGTDQKGVGSATEVFNVTVKDIGVTYAGPGMPEPLPEPAVSPNEEYESGPVIRDPGSDPPYEPITTERKPGGSDE